MADNKVLQTRIKLKIDTLENWQAIWGTFVPLKGEKILFQIPTNTTLDSEGAKVTGTTPPQVISKTGDGTTVLRDLPWDSALAADVAAWAKEASLQYKDLPKELTDEIDALQAAVGTESSVAKQIEDAIKELDVTDTAVEKQLVSAVNQEDGKIKVTRRALVAADIPTIEKSQVNGLQKDLEDINAELDTYGKVLTLKAGNKTVTYNGTAAAGFEVTAADLGLTNALHFIGVSTTEIKDEGTETPTISGWTGPLVAGDVVLYGENEFVWDGSKWEELGEASSITSALNAHIKDFTDYTDAEEDWKTNNWKPFSTTDNGYTKLSGNANNMLFGDNTWHGAVRDDFVVFDCGSATMSEAEKTYATTLS